MTFDERRERAKREYEAARDEQAAEQASLESDISRRLKSAMNAVSTVLSCVQKQAQDVTTELFPPAPDVEVESDDLVYVAAARATISHKLSKRPLLEIVLEQISEGYDEYVLRIVPCLYVTYSWGSYRRVDFFDASHSFWVPRDSFDCPETSVQLHSLENSPNEQEVYDALSGRLAEIMGAYDADGGPEMDRLAAERTSAMEAAR